MDVPPGPARQVDAHPPGVRGLVGVDSWRSSGERAARSERPTRISAVRGRCGRAGVRGSRRAGSGGGRRRSGGTRPTWCAGTPGEPSWRGRTNEWTWDPRFRSTWHGAAPVRSPGERPTRVQQLASAAWPHLRIHPVPRLRAREQVEFRVACATVTPGPGALHYFSHSLCGVIADFPLLGSLSLHPSLTAISDDFLSVSLAT